MFNVFLYGALTVQFCMSSACQLLEVLPIIFRSALYIFSQGSVATKNGRIPRLLRDRDGPHYFTIIWSGTYLVWQSEHRAQRMIFFSLMLVPVCGAIGASQLTSSFGLRIIYWTFVVAFLTQAMYAHRIRALGKLKYISWCIVVVWRPGIILRSSCCLSLAIVNFIGTYCCHRHCANFNNLQLRTF